MNGPGIIHFLNTQTSKEDLAAALRVVREFKAQESRQEWLMVPFDCWLKLEQLQEFLEFLVEGTELKEDTVRAREAAAS